MRSDNIPNSVRVVEVGPRDGLQNEAQTIDVADRVELIHQLTEAGLSHIEAGSFVSPKWVPQMAMSDAVFAGITRKPDVTYSALTPNMRGFEAAVDAGVDEVAVFAAASEAFSQKNINCSIAESIERFRPVVVAAHAAGIRVRGYISCVVGCPYDGAVLPEQTAAVCEELLALGCYEVSLGDTIGVGTAGSISRLLENLLSQWSAEHFALHCHDTYGQALANVLTGLQHGIAVFDSSIAGLGGCPYAKGASGNVATEDLLYLLEGLGIETGIDLERAVAAGEFISSRLGRETQSRVARALTSRQH